MSTRQSYSTVKTKLISSYAWDTAIDFIQKTNSDNEHSDYATNTPEGNYSDTTFNYTDIEGNTNQIKEKLDGVLVPTGQTTAVNNIYDMGGNLQEYTIEKSPTQGYAAFLYPYINCWGNFEGRSNRYPAGNRNRYSDGSIGNERSGFRIALYLN